MRKFAKMSLVAAVAVAGLTSSASAVDLEKAIKGVDISGQFRYRFQERKFEKTGADTTGTDVEVEVTATIPVNDNVSAVIMVDNANNDGDAAGTSGSVDIEEYYFQYANGPVTALAGFQTIPGRITDGAQGDGIVALYNAGTVTVGAAAFANHNVGGLTGDNSVMSAIAMGSVGPVSFQAQYANVDEVADTYNVKVDGKFGPVKAGVEYTATELDAKTGTAANLRDDRSTLKAYVAASAGIVSAKLAYAATGDNGSGSLDNQTTTEVETPAEFLLWNLGTATLSDADVYAADLSVKVTDKLSVRAAYAAGEVGNATGKDVSEALAQVTYKMSKNLTTYVRYSQFDTSATTDDNDGQRGRVEIKYSF
jgi:hypothetical protein